MSPRSALEGVKRLDAVALLGYRAESEVASERSSDLFFQLCEYIGKYSFGPITVGPPPACTHTCQCSIDFEHPRKIDLRTQSPPKALIHVSFFELFTLVVGL